MRLRIFQSDKGDCLLLTGTDGKTILVDGGMYRSYKDQVRPYLGRMRTRGEEVDLVYISHIDQDHIAGILQLLNDEVAWRVYDHHKASPNGNPQIRKPAFPRPPVVRDIWHNAFHEQVGKNHGEIEDMLAASARLFADPRNAERLRRALVFNNLVTSKKEAHLVSRRIGARQLKIPLNRQFDGKLAMVQANKPPVALGQIRIHVIGPLKSELDELRKEWNTWLESAAGGRALDDIADRSSDDEERLGVLAGAAGPSVTAEIGNRGAVTTPNLASLMLFVEEGAKTLLLTGDGHADDVLEGLKRIGKLPDNQGLHVDVLKVMHHGSEHNTTMAFARRITANHYIFCGNGSSGNPDPRVVEAFAKSRIGTPSERSPNPEVGRRFRFWFNTAPDTAGLKPSYAENMAGVRSLVSSLAQQSDSQLRFRFFDEASLAFTV